MLLPPSASTSIQLGPVIEEVKMIRDDMANMVWGLESTVENGIGGAWSGNQRDAEAKSGEPPSKGSPWKPGDPLLKYQVQTTVPNYWIPFLPVSIDPSRGKIELEKSAMLDESGNPIEAIGRILNPNIQPPYYLREEEVPRSGVKIIRSAQI